MENNKKTYKKIIIDGKDDYIVTKLNLKYTEHDKISKKNIIKTSVERKEVQHESDSKK